MKYNTAGHSTLNNCGDIETLACLYGQLFSAGSDGKIRVWIVKDLSLVDQWSAHEDRINNLKICKKGQVLYSCSDDGFIKKWSLEGELINTSENKSTFDENSNSGVNCIEYQNNNIYSGDTEGTIKKWSHDLSLVFEKFTYSSISSISLSEDGTKLFAGSFNQVAIYDISLDLKSDMYKNTISSISCLNGRGCTKVTEQYIGVVNIETGFGATIYKNESKYPLYVNLEPHLMILNVLIIRNSLCVTAGWDGLVKFFDLASGQPATCVCQCSISGCLNALIFADDDATVFVGGEEGKIYKLNLQ